MWTVVLRSFAEIDHYGRSAARNALRAFNYRSTTRRVTFLSHRVLFFLKNRGERALRAFNYRYTTRRGTILSHRVPFSEKSRRSGAACFQLPFYHSTWYNFVTSRSVFRRIAATPVPRSLQSDYLKTHGSNMSHPRAVSRFFADREAKRG